MKKLFIICTIVLAFGLTAGQVFAQAQYTIDGSNPFALQLEVGSCQTVTIAIDPGGEINTPLISAGFALVFDSSQVTLQTVSPYDGTVTPALWDSGFTNEITVPGQGVILQLGNFATVPISDLRLADVELCGLEVGQIELSLIPIPGFDTIVGDTTVWDSQVAAGIINLEQGSPTTTTSQPTTTTSQPTTTTSQPTTTTSQPTTTTSIGEFCGDLIKNGDEDCDGDDFGGVTCEDFDLVNGMLMCTEECVYDLSACDTGTPTTTTTSQPTTTTSQPTTTTSQPTTTTSQPTTTTSQPTTTTSQPTTTTSQPTTTTSQPTTTTTVPTTTTTKPPTTTTTVPTTTTSMPPTTTTTSMPPTTTTTIIQTDCGDGFIEGVEECDGDNLGCATCESLGYDGGTLSCYDDCVLNRSDCFITQSSDTRVMFGYDAMDSTGIYINDYRLSQCGQKRSADACICDPACEWDDGECYSITAGTLRLFGEAGLDAAFPYTDPTGPIDPTSDEAPEKDFLTWNPAIMDEYGTEHSNFAGPAVVVNGQDAHEKVFLRQWYVPSYREPRGRVWTNQDPEFSRDIVKEYTFMLLDPNNDPFAGGPGSTSFIFPAAYSNEYQIGLDGWDVNGDGIDDPTLLKGVDVASKTIDIGTGLVRLAGSLDDTDMPSDVEFIDHKAEITFVGSSINASWAMVKIYYPDDFDSEDQIGAGEFVMNEGDILIAGRHEVNVAPDAQPIPVLKPWYLKLVAVDILQDNTRTAIVEVGRLLQEGESFFSDGAEYDVAKLHILNPPASGRLQYITLRNPLPKDRDVWLPYLTVMKRQVGMGDAFPMLPPFNKDHEVIDDIDGSSPFACGLPVVDDVCPVVERWVRQRTEPRFTTKLCEILNGLGWDSLDVKTLPDFYAELMLPEQEDAPGRPGDYLLTSSFRAPNSNYARVSFHYDAAPSGGLTDVYINEGIRVYGEDSISAAFPYATESGPFDPASDEAPGKDFITYNPAIMPDQGPGSTQFFREALFVNGNDAAEKVFLRQWYVPEYPEPTGVTWNDAQPTILSADIVKEYTFMLLEPDLDPYPGSAGSTSFIFPTAYDNSTTDRRDNDQIGLESWDVDDDGDDNPTLLNDVDLSTKTIDISTGLLRLQGVNAGQRNYETDVEFLDHRAEIEFVGSSVGTSWIEVTIYYPSEYEHEDQIGASRFYMAEGDVLVAGRHTVDAGQPEAITAPWYIELVAVDIFTTPYTAVVRAGRLLQEGESFFSDGAEYDVAKIHTVGNDLLYITLRNPLPKERDVSLDLLTVVKEGVDRGDRIPMLPPFNRTHAVIDDIGLTQNDDCDECGCQFPIVTDVDAVVERWIDETTEPRFATRLCEIYDGSDWREQTFMTMPNAYTEFALPRQHDGEVDCLRDEGDVTPGDYLLTSSWVLQDSEGTPPPKTYCISGMVADPQDNPIAGVLVSAGSRSDSTGANGDYEICELRSGRYTVAPSSASYTFDPEDQSVTVTDSDVTGVDFTGNAVNNSTGPFTISGKVTDGDSSNPIGGVTIDIALQIVGGVVGSAQTEADGTYVVAGVPSGGDYMVTATKDGCEFEPIHTAINDLDGDETAVDFTGNCTAPTTTTTPTTVPPTTTAPPTTTTTPPTTTTTTKTEVAQVSIQQEYLIRSRWFILPAFLTIKGDNTNFNTSTTVAFDPKKSVLKLMQRVVDEENIACFILVMPSWFAIADTEEVTLKVTTGPEEAESAVDIKMLSTVLAGD